jgi:predicted Fe-S protein YdhL (DUF1289 family)
MIPSPCINICQMDPQRPVPGCFRTIDEITVWSKTDDTTRAHILAAITTRRMAQAHPGSPLPSAGTR